MRVLLFFTVVSISYTCATLLNLDIISTIHFTNKFSDLSIYKKHVEVLKYFILNISKVEDDLTIYYIGNIDKETRKIFEKTHLIYPSNEAIIDENQYEQEQDSENLVVSIADYFAIIQNLFNIFIEKLKNSTDSLELCSLPWVNGIPQGTNLVDSLRSIKQITSGVNFISLFNNIMNIFNNNDCLISKNKYCDKNITMPDKLISMYHFVAAVDRKYFIMESFVQLSESACKNDTNTYSLSIAKKSLTIRTQQYLEILKHAVLHSERGLYRCDRKKYLQIDPHYIELEGFKRTVVLNERVHSAENTCILTCSNINDEKLSISQADFSARREYCPGRLINCKSGGDVELCHAVSGSSRLYEWIKTNLTHEIYGEYSECSGSIEIMQHYQYEVHSSFYCEPCICTCVQDTDYLPSRFGISLKEEIADIAKNEVITGIRFVKMNKIIYPQIETGKLLPDGHIEEFSNKWKPVNSIDTMDNIFNAFPEKNKQEYVYFGSSSQDAQFINLEQIYLIDKYVITGIKFTMVTRQSSYVNTKGNFISIAIQTTHFDIKTGELGQYPSSWINFDSVKNEDQCRTYQHRRELRFPESDNPLKYDKFYLNSINGDYIGFWPSALKKDAGQTTLPFFDTIPVFGIPRFPLGGIGLYHKGPVNSKGFIAFKIAGIDFSKTINTVIPPEDRVKFDSVLSSMYID